MVYTQEHPVGGGICSKPPCGPMVNKPGLSSSTDGVAFSPNTGGANYLEVRGYPDNWTRADVNGGNVLLPVNSTLYLFFVDFESRNHSVYLATAPMPSPGQPMPRSTLFTCEHAGQPVHTPLSNHLSNHLSNRARSDPAPIPLPGSRFVPTSTLQTAIYRRACTLYACTLSSCVTRRRRGAWVHLLVGPGWLQTRASRCLREGGSRTTSSA